MITRRPALAAAFGLAVASALLAPPTLAAARKVRQVSADAIAGSDVTTPFSSLSRFSPDGEWIAYLHDAEVNDAQALWVVRRSGGTPKRMSATLPPGSAFWAVEFSPDSRWLLYTAEQDTVGRVELYRVPLLGTYLDGVKLNPPITTGDVYSMRFSGDGSRVVFNTQAATAGGAALHSVPMGGAADDVVPLDGLLDASGETVRYQLAGTRVVYTSRVSDTSPWEIWSVPIAGPATAKVRLSPLFDPGAGAYELSLDLAPDGSRVAFEARSTASGPYELWSAPVDGGTGSAVLVGPLPANDRSIESVDFTADGEWLVYSADAEVADQVEVYSVPADGSAAAVKLNTALIAAGDVDNVALSLDGATVFYVADWAVDGRFEAFSVPVGGPAVASVRLNRTLLGGESVLGVGELAGGEAVYALAVSGVARELRGVPSSGPASEEYELTGRAETSIQASIGGRGYVNYVADLEVAGTMRLWSARLDGLFTPQDLGNPLWTGPLTFGSHLATTPNGLELFFIAAVDDGPSHLWSTRVDGGQLFPLRLSPVPTSSGEVSDAALDVSPDGHGVLFHADPDIATRTELFLADSLVFAADFDEEGNTGEWTP